MLCMSNGFSTGFLRFFTICSKMGRAQAKLEAFVEEN